MAAAPVPTGPIESDPIEFYTGRALSEVRELLDAAVSGLPVGAYDTRILHWIKQADQPTIVTVASLLTRAREAG